MVMRPEADSNLPTVADALARALQRHGVDTVFGQSIPSLFFLAAPRHGIRQIAYRTENAGGIMADGYARISGRIGVVAAQNGPAATLLVPALAEALKASIPVLAIVQDVALANMDRNAFQELDHLDLFRGCAKWVRRLHTPERVDDLVDLAIVAATSGRPGPAVLLVPLDLLDRPSLPSGARHQPLGGYPLDRVVAAPDSVQEAARLIAEADAPLVIAGGGVHLSGASPALAALQDRFALPVATTAMGKGAVDETHPLSIGVVGYAMGTGGMSRHHRPIVERADVILLVGTRTNQNGTDSWGLLKPGARIVHIDVDGQEVGRNYEALRLVGDADLSLQALATALAAHDCGKRHAARRALEREIAGKRELNRAEAEQIAGSREQRPMRPEHLMAALDRILATEDIVVADASYASIWVTNGLRSRRAGQRFITPRGIAGLGWGLPLAMGAKLAAPRARVFCFAGDGGFAHVWSELETVRRAGLGIVLTVLNNQSLGYQKHAEQVLYGAHTDAVDFAPVDHAAIARACGVRGVRVASPEDYAAELEAAAGRADATVIEAMVDPDAHPPITAFERTDRQIKRTAAGEAT